MGKIAVLSDIHSNISALKKSLEIIEDSEVDSIIILGDIVGYGKHPNECCNFVRELKCPVIAGNHDWAAAGLTEYEKTFSDIAVKGIDYARNVMTCDNLEWLRNLPLSYQFDGIEFVHSSLVNPDDWHYLVLSYGSTFLNSHWVDVRLHLQKMQGKISFVGHSHVPTIFKELSKDRIKVINPSDNFYQMKGSKSVIDVGSIGLPRNSALNASFAIYDTLEETVIFKRFKIKLPI